MKALFTAIFFLMLTLTTGTVLAEKAQAKKAPVSWLYVYVADKGKITKTNNGYLLILDRKDLTNVMMFSDRPARVTKHVTAKDLKKNWKLGENSFEKDPPNAAVLIDGDLQTVQLVSMHFRKDRVEFDLKSDGKSVIHETPDGRATIFIDSVNMDLQGGVYIYPIQT